MQTAEFQVDEGERKEQVVMGGLRVTSFIKDVVAGRHEGRKYKFDDHFVMKLHDLVSMSPGMEGFLRLTDSTTVSGQHVARFDTLPEKMHLFGRWLEHSIEKIKQHQEDIVLALEISAASHYGLVMPEFHPFDNGNGRTARALMNTVLMSGSYELTAYGLAIPPIPIIRSSKEASNDYIDVLRQVDAAKDMRPVMVFIAKRWIENTDDRLEVIHHRIKTPKSPGDKRLIDKLEWRKDMLQSFINGSDQPINNGNGHNSHEHNHKAHKVYPVPDYFDLKHIKLTNMEL